MDELARWLGEQLATDDRIARAATEGPWSVDSKSYAESISAPDGTQVVAGGRWGGEASVFESTEDALHIAEWDPARVLREVESKRGMVVRIGANATIMGWDEVHGDLLRLLAAPYADRPGYQEAWRP
ncbi:DUF6221 family protein [Streptomyces prunicolor]|uniref:DUF6221 family protein n=1 Tax=Streptomyces prunicolor TaxID=67348 RepID=UPI00037092AA|nr:DUF6221 family protein [Streptomyces prunicolor]